MPYFEQEVLETRVYEVIYTVKAKDLAEAKDKIAAGDTVAENEIRCREVIGRDEWDQPLKVSKPSPAKPSRRVKLDMSPEDAALLVSFLTYANENYQEDGNVAQTTGEARYFEKAAFEANRLSFLVAAQLQEQKACI